LGEPKADSWRWGNLVKWLDAAMVSAAIGLTACTVFLCAADDSGMAGSPVPAASPFDADLPAIILHECADGSRCPKALAAEKETTPGRDLQVSLDHPDRQRLVEFLAGLCRERRIPPERIFAHRQVEAGCRCGISIQPELLVGDVRREMMR